MGEFVSQGVRPISDVLVIVERPRFTSSAGVTGRAVVLEDRRRAGARFDRFGTRLANTTQEVVFGVGHGCAGADSSAVQIEIPAGVGSVRPLASGFEQVDVETDATGAVVAVTWQKAEGSVLDSDTQYYKLTLRLKLPNQPFSTFYFPAHQTCRGLDGSATVVDWVGIDEAEGSQIEPAPALRVVPARSPGWNQFTLPHALPDLAPFFVDAQIVWLGNSAYSSSPTTTD